MLQKQGRKLQFLNWNYSQIYVAETRKEIKKLIFIQYKKSDTFLMILETGYF